MTSRAGQLSGVGGLNGGVAARYEIGEHDGSVVAEVGAQRGALGVPAADRARKRALAVAQDTPVSWRAVVAWGHARRGGPVTRPERLRACQAGRLDDGASSERQSGGAAWTCVRGGRRAGAEPGFRVVVG